jgi:hypothetical protein
MFVMISMAYDIPYETLRFTGRNERFFVWACARLVECFVLKGPERSELGPQGFRLTGQPWRPQIVAL